VNNLARDADPEPLPAWELTGRQLAQEDRAWDRWEQGYDNDPDD
jgi:hypothetical protein